MTPAQQIVAIIDGMGWNKSQAARLLLVDRISIQRYYRQARIDDGEDVDTTQSKANRQPSASTVRLAELVADSLEEL